MYTKRQKGETPNKKLLAWAAGDAEPLRPKGTQKMFTGTLGGRTSVGPEKRPFERAQSYSLKLINNF